MGGWQFSAEILVDSELNVPVAVLTRTGNSSAEIRIAPSFGSNMYRFCVDGNDLMYCDREILKNQGLTGNFIMWPLPNRVRDKRYTFGGRTYSLEDIDRGRKEVGPVIDGLVDNQPFEILDIGSNETSAWVVTQITISQDSPLFRHFPFASQLTLRYELSMNSITTVYTVENTGNKRMPFGFGLHPYFATFGQFREAYITIPAESVMERDSQLVPSGRLIPVVGTNRDVRKPTPISEVFLDEDYADISPGEPTVLTWEHLEKTLYCESSLDFTHTVLYTQDREQYVCLENVTGAIDMINLDNEAMHTSDDDLRITANLLTLEPGEQHEGYVRYRISSMK